MPENTTAKDSPFIHIEVAYALPKEQTLLRLRVKKETTVAQAIEQSKILQRHPEIDLNKSKVGIFSKVCQLTDRLHEGDRIEIYRELIADPKEVRKARAAAQKKNQMRK